MRKKYLIIVVVVLISIIFIYVYLNRKTTEQLPLPNGQKQTPTSAITIADYKVLGRYLMNTILSQPSVLNVGWNDRTLVYATSQGIYNANTNAALYTGQIRKPTFSYFADVLFLKGDGVWGYFNHLTLATRDIRLPGQNFEVSVDGKEAFQISQTVIEKAELATGGVTRQTFDGPITSYNNASPSDTYITYSSKDKKEYLVHLNSTLTVMNQVEIGIDDRVIASSPDGVYAVVTDNKKLKFVQNNKVVHEISFSFAQKLSAKWNPTGTIVVIEELFPDPVGRVVQNIWVVSSSTYTTTILTDSKPIPRKLSSIQNPILDMSETVIPLIERDGGIWLLSLVKDQFPSLGEAIQTTPYRGETKDHFD